jgi:hypothetical protein
MVGELSTGVGIRGSIPQCLRGVILSGLVVTIPSADRRRIGVTENQGGRSPLFEAEERVG